MILELPPEEWPRPWQAIWLPLEAPSEEIRKAIQVILLQERGKSD